MGLALQSSLNGNSSWPVSTLAGSRHSQRQRFSRLGLVRCPLATSCFIGQPLALGADDGEIGALGVVNAKLDAVAVPEIELTEIPLQVGFGDVLINAVDAALEDRKVALDGVGVGVAPDVFLGAVVDGLVRSEVPADAGIDRRLVAHEAAVHVGVAPEDGPQQLGSDVRDVEAADLAAALYQRHDGLLGRGRFECAAGGLAANVGFIGLHGLASAAQRRGPQVAIVLHGFADAMAKEPSGFHAAPEHALDLVGADALFAGAHQVNDLQPEMQRQVGRLENGPDPHGEGLPAGVALVEAGTGGLALQAADPSAIRIAAVGAGRAFRPKPRLDVGESGGFVLELRGREDGMGHD